MYIIILNTRFASVLFITHSSAKLLFHKRNGVVLQKAARSSAEKNIAVCVIHGFHSAFVTFKQHRKY